MALEKLSSYLQAVYEGLEEGAVAVGRSPYNTTWPTRHDRAAAKELTVIFATNAACVDVTDGGDGELVAASTLREDLKKCALGMPMVEMKSARH